MGTKRNKKMQERQKRRRRIRMLYRFIIIIIVLILLGITYLLLQKSLNHTTNSEISPEADSKDNKSTNKKPVEKKDKPAKTNQTESKDFTMLFTGDILFSQYVLNNESNAGLDGIITDDLQKEMQNAEITMVNQEFPFSTRGTQAEDKQFTFRVDPQKVELFKQL